MENKKLKKFVYNPQAIDTIAELEITLDHLHWKLLCKQAVDFKTTPSHLVAMVLEKYLVNTGYLDPRAPSTEGFGVAVSIKELRDNPDTLFNFKPNYLLTEPKAKKKAKSEEDDDELDLS